MSAPQDPALPPAPTQANADKRKYEGGETPDNKKRCVTDAMVDNDAGELPTQKERAEGYYPLRPAFDEEVCNILLTNSRLVKRLREEIAKHPRPSQSLKNIAAKAEQIQQLPTGEQMLIGLVGATGSGKSSLINRMTDQESLAKELSAGESCTSVPTLYVHRLEWQTEDYAAEIRYFPISKCRTLLKELIQQYNTFVFEFDEEWDHNQRNQFSQQADTAIQIFQTLFCHKIEFESPGAAENYLKWIHGNKCETMLLETMASWCEQSFKQHPKDNDSGLSRCEFPTVRELRSRIDPLTAPIYSHDQPSLWPLVDHVTIGVSKPRVLRYVTVVDLPGITDINTLRVDATHDWIRKCQALWYVATVDRICTDEKLEKTLSDYAERFRDRFAIIVTKIDVGISDELAEDMEAKGQSVGEYWNINHGVADREERLQEIRRIRRRTTDMAEKAALYDGEEKIEQEIEKEQSRSIECVVDARNDYIVRRLKREKRKYLREGAELRVICVSNSQYSQLKGTSKLPGVPFRNLKETGIPELRSYALSLASPSFWAAYEEHLLYKVRVFFSGVHGWAQGFSAKQAAGIIETVKQVYDRWTGIASNTVPKMLQDHQKGILQCMRDGYPESQKCVMKWYRTVTSERWAHNSFLAFFRNDGKYNTCAVGTESWNERFIEYQTKNVLGPNWEEKLPPPERFFDEAIDQLIEAIKGLPDDLRRLPASVSLQIEAFDGIFAACVSGVEAAHRRCKEEYEQSLANVRLDATLDQHTGHFTQAMKPCYHAGWGDKGKGVCKRLENLLYDHLTNKDPLGQATEKLSKALSDITQKHVLILHCDIDSVLGEITAHFEDNMPTEEESAEEKQARQDISGFLSSVMPVVNRIDNDLSRIRYRYSGL